MTRGREITADKLEVHGAQRLAELLAESGGPHGLDRRDGGLNEPG
jgi:hypothetical protein